MNTSKFYGKQSEECKPEESEDENLRSDDEYDTEKVLKGLSYEDATNSEESEGEDVPNTSVRERK